MTNDFKKTLGENTEQIENKVKELTPYYTNLEPWQRGLILIALITLLLISIYYLTKPDLNLSAKKEAQIEEKLMRQMAFFKRLKE